MSLDETHDLARNSWVQSANQKQNDFPIQNLPLGIFSRIGEAPKFGIAIGDFVLDVAAVFDCGLITGPALAATEAVRSSTLNRIFALDPKILTALRRQIADLLDENGAQRTKAETNSHALLVSQADCQFHLPAQVGDFTDFFAGIHHATNAGALFRQDNPLPQNYKWLPIAYHGRSSSVQVSGIPVHRPKGQVGGRAGSAPVYVASGRLDFELELGFYIGRGNASGRSIAIMAASDHIVGYCLLNDWSARDIQRWESVPMGPFLGKSFATSVSPWVVTADALRPFRCPVMGRASNDPAPLPYLFDPADQQNGGLDIALSVSIQTEIMRRDGHTAVTLITSNAKYLYWTPAQMVAHHASGGCNLQPGDLMGTGTISGPDALQVGSMLELTAGGRKPIELPNGEHRTFLEDGDEIIFSARCNRKGFASIGFGSCVGRVLPAQDP